jgi:drug/metabolite transporter (DMT)-like permease
MPERKGRKRRSRERRRPAGPRPEALPSEGGARPPAPRAGRAEPSRPALRVRYAGFLLGVLTMFIGALTVAQGIASSGANAVVLLGVGAFLVALAVVLGALSVAPDRVRALFERRATGRHG